MDFPNDHEACDDADFVAPDPVGTLSAFLIGGCGSELGNDALKAQTNSAPLAVEMPTGVSAPTKADPQIVIPPSTGGELLEAASDDRHAHEPLRGPETDPVTVMNPQLQTAGATAKPAKNSLRRDNLKKTSAKLGRRPSKPSAAKMRRDDIGRRFLEEHQLLALAVHAEELAKADAKAAGLLHSSIAPLLALDAAQLVQESGFSEACKLQGVPFTERTRKNPDLALLRLAFPGMDGKRASRCARALAYARSKGVTAATFVKFASDNRGIEGCVKAALQRGGSAGDGGPPPKPLVVMLAPDLPDGERAILVRVTGRRAVFVKEVPM